MKVGIVVEGVRDGADAQICAYAIKKLSPKNEEWVVIPQALGNKKELVRRCGGAAKGLLNEGCERIVIVWDVKREFGQDPCLKRDREKIFSSLKASEISQSNILRKIVLVGVTDELETWLLADERALRDAISSAAHPVKKVNPIKKLEEIEKPKVKLRGLFREHHRQYDEARSALKIAQAIPDLTRLQNCPSFCRFAEKLTGKSFDALKNCAR